jgi:hypothetical protein
VRATPAHQDWDTLLALCYAIFAVGTVVLGSGVFAALVLLGVIPNS